MKFGSLYTELTKLPPEVQEVPVSAVQESEARTQVRHQWKQSTVTQELVQSLKQEINDLIVSSISLAISYPQTSNHQQIVQNLIRIDTLQKLLDTYVYNDRK